MSRLESPGDQSVRVLLTCHSVETDWIRRGCKKCAECWMVLQEEKRPQEEGLTDRKEKTLPCRSKQHAGEGGRSVTDCDC